MIDGSIGELSPFHETFGYYARGIGTETAALPSGWGTRVVRLQNEHTGGTISLCLSPADLEELPPKIRRSMTFVPVESMDEVLATALVPKEKGAGASCGEAASESTPAATD